MKPSVSISAFLLGLLCLLLPQTLAFWVAPMWGNKVEGEAYGPQELGGGGSIAPAGGYSGMERGDGVYGNFAGEAGGSFHKYPGWVTSKHASPFPKSLGKRYGSKTIWSILFDCSVSPRKCPPGENPVNDALLR